MSASSQSSASPLPDDQRHGEIALREFTRREFELRVQFFDKMTDPTRYNESEQAGEGTGA